jgi:hypothetical protein
VRIFERWVGTILTAAIVVWMSGMMCAGNPKWIAVPAERLQQDRPIR